MLSARRLGLSDRPPSRGRLPIHFREEYDDAASLESDSSESKSRRRRESSVARVLFVVAAFAFAGLWVSILYLDQHARWLRLLRGPREMQQLWPEDYDREYDAVVRSRNERATAGIDGGDELVDAFRRTYARGYAAPPEAYRIDGAAASAARAKQQDAWADHHVLGPMWSF